MRNFTIWLNDVKLTIHPAIDNVMLNCNVFDIVDVPGSYSYNASSDYDYYGYRELSFDIMFAEAEDYDGNIHSLNEEAIDAIIEKYSEEIEDKLWDKLDEGEWYVD